MLRMDDQETEVFFEGVEITITVQQAMPLFQAEGRY